MSLFILLTTALILYDVIINPLKPIATHAPPLSHCFPSLCGPKVSSVWVSFASRLPDLVGYRRMARLLCACFRTSQDAAKGSSRIDPSTPCQSHFTNQPAPRSHWRAFFSPHLLLPVLFCDTRWSAVEEILPTTFHGWGALHCRQHELVQTVALLVQGVWAIQALLC